MSADRMLVTFLLDRSGSMANIKATTIEAFNGYLAQLQDETAAGLHPDQIDFTFLQFDSPGIQKVCVAIPVKQAVPLNCETFVPRGGTPLIDSAWATIAAVEESLKARDDKPKVVICIQTDGDENESVRHTWEELRGLIERKTEEGWQFNFMGAGINAYKQGSRMGLHAQSTMSYGTGLRETTMAFAASASNARGFGDGSMRSANYSAAQKHAAGDKFDPLVLKQAQQGVDKIFEQKAGHTLDLTKE